MKTKSLRGPVTAIAGFLVWFAGILLMAINGQTGAPEWAFWLGFGVLLSGGGLLLYAIWP